jgi:hypothetical protein
VRLIEALPVAIRTDPAQRCGELRISSTGPGEIIFAMTGRTEFTSDEARTIGTQLGIDWATAPFDIEQFRAGMNVELEHGLRDPKTNVTDDDPVVTGKIALAHLNELPDYYTRLERMESGPA